MNLISLLSFTFFLLYLSIFLLLSFLPSLSYQFLFFCLVKHNKYVIYTHNNNNVRKIRKSAASQSFWLVILIYICSFDICDGVKYTLMMWMLLLLDISHVWAWGMGWINFSVCYVYLVLTLVVEFIFGGRRYLSLFSSRLSKPHRTTTYIRNDNKGNSWWDESVEWR